jgi:hypothetical protein
VDRRGRRGVSDDTAACALQGVSIWRITDTSRVVDLSIASAAV